MDESKSKPKQRKIADLPAPLKSLLEGNKEEDNAWSKVQFRMEENIDPKDEANESMVAYELKDVQGQNYTLNDLTLDQLRILCKYFGCKYTSQKNKFQCRRELYITSQYRAQHNNSISSYSTCKMGKLDDKVAIITGGTSGIGKATAILFANEGAHVIITGRRTELGQTIVDDYTRYSSNRVNTMNTASINITSSTRRRRGSIEFVKADHMQLQDCTNVVNHVLSKYSKIDILFNNAGMVPSGTAEQTTDELFTQTMTLNVTSVFRMCKLVLPHMRANNNGGVIVNNASDWSIVGGRNAVAYCTSKGAVVQMTKAMALDHAKERIRINAVCPGDTYVERWEHGGYYGCTSMTLQQANQEADSTGSIPMGRVGMADEIAKAVLFLASNDSSYVTGTTLVVDGGNTAA